MPLILALDWGGVSHLGNFVQSAAVLTVSAPSFSVLTKRLAETPPLKLVFSLWVVSSAFELRERPFWEASSLLSEVLNGCSWLLDPEVFASRAGPCGGSTLRPPAWFIEQHALCLIIDIQFWSLG